MLSLAFAFAILVSIIAIVASGAGLSPFHILAYTKVEAVSQSNADMLAVNDPIISQRNSHFIFSEPYSLIHAFFNAPHISDIRTNIPSWNSVGRHHVWPLDTGGTVGLAGSPPRIQDFRAQPLPLPINEEIAFEQSCNSSGASSLGSIGLLAVSPTDTFNRNLTPGLPRLVIAGSITTTTTAGAWSGPQAITFSDTFRGGWYTINGIFAYNNASANPALGFRIFFPRAAPLPGNSGRILRPGGYVTGAIGNQEFLDLPFGMGEWGRFNSFEPIQAEIITQAAQTAIVTNFRIDLSYLGTNPSYELVKGY